MSELLRRKNIDFLVQQFWRKGYLTLSRKFGTYLPDPTTIGGFDVDIIARQKDKYAIGVTINDEDFKDINALLNKLKHLATRQTRRGGMPVLLFVGVKEQHYKSIKMILEGLEENIQKNIKLFQITDRPAIRKHQIRNQSEQLFS